jgi:hypothetical protein
MGVSLGIVAVMGVALLGMATAEFQRTSSSGAQGKAWPRINRIAQR